MLTLDTSKPVDRTGNAYCGPLVVAAIMGTSTGDVASQVYAMRKAGESPRKMKRVPAAVKGTTGSELVRLLQARGYAVYDTDIGARYRPQDFRTYYADNDANKSYRTPNPLVAITEYPLAPWSLVRRVLPTLGDWLRHTDGKTYIIHLPGHWALASGGKFTETYTRGAWVPFREAPSRNRHVTMAYLVTQGPYQHALTS